MPAEIVQLTKERRKLLHDVQQLNNYGPKASLFVAVRIFAEAVKQEHDNGASIELVSDRDETKVKFMALEGIRVGKLGKEPGLRQKFDAAVDMAFLPLHFILTPKIPLLIDLVTGRHKRLVFDGKFDPGREMEVLESKFGIRHEELYDRALKFYRDVLTGQNEDLTLAYRDKTGVHLIELPVPTAVDMFPPHVVAQRYPEQVARPQAPASPGG